MIVIIFPLIIMALSFAVLFNMSNPSQTAYMIVGIINIFMLLIMFFGTKFYQDTKNKREIIEFNQEVQLQIKNLKEKATKLNQQQLEFEIQRINNYIKEFTSKHKIKQELVNIDDFV